MSCLLLGVAMGIQYRFFGHRRLFLWGIQNVRRVDIGTLILIDCPRPATVFVPFISSIVANLPFATRVALSMFARLGNIDPIWRGVSGIREICTFAAADVSGARVFYRRHFPKKIDGVPNRRTVGAWVA